eukprot:scaffold24_cov341-Pavlova_lutheri.AAC.96
MHGILHSVLTHQQKSGAVCTRVVQDESSCPRRSKLWVLLGIAPCKNSISVTPMRFRACGRSPNVDGSKSKSYPHWSRRSPMRAR